MCLPPYREKGIPNYNYKKGKLTFVKAKLLRPNPEEPMVRTVRGREVGDKLGKAAATFCCFPQEETVQGFVAFSGTGEQLRIRKKNKS